MDEIKIHKSPWRAIRLMLLCSPFIILSLYDFLNHKLIVPTWLNWACICFFGLGIPVGIFNLFDRRPQIIINSDGIFDRMAYKDFINWNLIKDAYLVNVHNQKFICLIIDPVALNLIKKKTMVKLSKQLGFQEINLSLGQVKIDEIRFKDFILAMSKAEDIQRKNLINQYHS